MGAATCMSRSQRPGLLSCRESWLCSTVQPVPLCFLRGLCSRGSLADPPHVRLPPLLAGRQEREWGKVEGRHQQPGRCCAIAVVGAMCLQGGALPCCAFVGGGTADAWSFRLHACAHVLFIPCSHSVCRTKWRCPAGTPPSRAREACAAAGLQSLQTCAAPGRAAEHCLLAFSFVF